MRVKCHKCKYSWDYNGKNKNNSFGYATCPSCHTNTKLHKEGDKKC